MRPAYEQLADREKQGAVAAELMAAWDLAEVIPMPRYSAVDFILLDRQTKPALAELKCRNVKSLHYPTLILSQRKVIRAVGAADALSCPFYLIVQWLDGIFWQQLSGGDLIMLTAKIGGRTDRGDVADMEPIYELPTAGFGPLRNVT